MTIDSPHIQFKEYGPDRRPGYKAFADWIRRGATKGLLAKLETIGLGHKLTHCLFEKATGRQSSLLHIAARYGRADAMRDLISLREHYDLYDTLAVRNTQGRTPFDEAASGGNTYVNGFVDKLSSDVDRSEQYVGRYPPGNYLETLKLLCSATSREQLNILLNQPNPKSGRMALHYAVISGDMDIVKYLVVQGAIHDAKSNAGSTPAELADKIAGSIAKTVAPLDPRVEQYRQLADWLRSDEARPGNLPGVQALQVPPVTITRDRLNQKALKRPSKYAIKKMQMKFFF